MLKLRAYTLPYTIAFVLVFLASCSNKKNTALTRTYHAINTKYNIHFNADEAYKESLKAKENERADNLSEILYIFPNNSDTSLQKATGNFTTTIDKTTKAIKLHSISAKPRRNPSKRKDPEYQAWLQQKEFNPYLENTWMLLGKAELEDKDYIRAISTFLYITKIYSSNPYIVKECQLWIARAYTEMGWMYEAADMLHKIDTSGDVPDDLLGLYATVKANYLIQQKEYREAIPLLEQAISREKNSRMKLRMKYLLAQIYTREGNNAKALDIFSSIPGLNTPSNYSFNANLQTLLLSAKTDKSKSIAKLEKMAKDSKNKDYVDAIYYTLGNIYLSDNDSTNAINNYLKAIDETEKGGYDKTLAQIKLADIYYNQHKFISAQPQYSAALQQITKANENYDRVAHRSPALDELVVYAKTVHEQDSIQRLAKMPEDERLAIINQKIKDIKEEEEKKKKEEEHEKLMAEREDRINSQDNNNNQIETGYGININSAQSNNSGSKFYFYNQQSVEQGKINFKKAWGNRKPEDDWRRRDKSNSNSDYIEEDIDNIEGQEINDEGENTIDNQDENSNNDQNDNQDGNSDIDIYSPEYYIQQLPMTPEALKESDDLIENGLYNMGMIYKYKLEDFNLSIDAFTDDVERFPDNPNLEKIYYELLLIYMQLDQSDMMNAYRNKLLAEFPSGIYAIPLSQPDYEWNFRNIAALQDSLYDDTYQAYLSSDIQTVRENSQSLERKYPFGDLMPKFMLLDALTYAQTQDIKSLENNLKKIVEKYPKDEEVTPFANSILERIANGQVLSSDGSPIKGIDWSEAFKIKEELAKVDSLLRYSNDVDAEYMVLLVYQEKTIDRNKLLYDVADYNFSNYVVQTFDLVFDNQSPIEILQVKGFESFTPAKSYINKMFEEEGLIQYLDSSITVIPISKDNYAKLLLRKNIDNYKSFYQETLGSQTPDLIAYWNKDRTTSNVNPADTIIIIEKIEVIENNDSNVIVKDPESNALDNSDAKPSVKPKEENKAPDTKQEDGTKANNGNAENPNNTGPSIKNPVDGMKGSFDKYDNKVKLTKEEKEALKKQKELEKQKQKELERLRKLELDSIQMHGKAVQDSLRKVADEELQEKKRIDEEKDRIAKENIKQKEEAQKQALKDREENRKERERGRKEREKAQKEKLRKQQEERNQKLKEQEQRKKEKERERKEREKARQLERKNKLKND